MRNFSKIKELSDYQLLDLPEPVPVDYPTPVPDVPELYILRMLIKPKYGGYYIPPALTFIKPVLLELANYECRQIKIDRSWCYLTIRHGPIKSATDDDFHFDGSSFRTDIIPERNYIWVNHSPTEYKAGNLVFPEDFDPVKYNLFTFAEHQLKNEPIRICEPKQWYLLSPFCFHRRPKIEPDKTRTFYRICFTDIEGRDVNNTQNPLLPTDAYGRDPVKTFRDKLKHYPT